MSMCLCMYTCVYVYIYICVCVDAALRGLSVHVSGPQNHSPNVSWDQSPETLGTWTLWDYSSPMFLANKHVCMYTFTGCEPSRNPQEGKWPCLVPVIGSTKAPDICNCLM